MALTRSELRTWYQLIGGALSLLGALDRELREDAGISHDEYLVLARLYRAPGRTLGMTELAGDVVFSPSRLSNTVSRFETRGLVTRRAGTQDKRCVEASLTAKGIRHTEEITQRHLRLVKELVFDAIGPEQARQAADVLDRIRKGIDDRDPGQGGPCRTAFTPRSPTLVDPRRSRLPV